MKKYFYLLTAVLIITLTSFVIFGESPSSVHIRKKPKKICGTCTTPTNLSASKGYNIITFDWFNTSNACNVSGYYNYDSSGPRVRNFQLLNVYPGAQLYMVNPGASSVEFSVTQICGDGTYSQSGGKLVYF